MITRLLAPIFAALMLLPAGCTIGASDAGSYGICSDSSAAAQAAEMAQLLTPAKAAGAFGAWMLEAPLGDAAFAHQLYAELRTAYGDEAPRVDAALDSLHRSYSSTDRAHMIVLSASPERVAGALLADTMMIGLIPEVERQYAADSLLLRRFRRAISYKQSN